MVVSAATAACTRGCRVQRAPQCGRGPASTRAMHAAALAPQGASAGEASATNRSRSGYLCSRPRRIPSSAGMGGSRHSVADLQQRPRIAAAASSSSSSDAEVYSGMFGDWRVDEQDVKEVTAYRLGISVATLSLLVASSSVFVPEDSALHQTLVSLLDPVTLLGAGGLGASLVLIHIYVTPLKRFLQLLFATGTLGALAIMASQEQPAAVYVVEHPVAVLAVGPLFASVTGLAFKEGLCYGKFEAAALFFVVPTLLLGHLFGFLPPQGEQGLLAAFCVLAAVFASRKYTQPIKDDIGDKSVFEFQALSEEDQQRKLAALKAAQNGGQDAFE